MSQKRTLLLLLGAALLILSVGIALKPLPQPQAYHQFADQRSGLGIPHFWNVFSNVLFAVGGVWGLFLLFSKGRVTLIDPREKPLWIGFSIGLILTAIGSSYYHLDPDNSRLAWDRLAMIIVFMSFVAAMISERVSPSLGLMLWPLLLLLGFGSVGVWVATGDLRFYLGVQAFTLLTIIIMWLTPSPYTRQGDLALVILFYVLAALFETKDHEIYQLSSHIISGHTLKHLSAGLAGLWVIRMIGSRKIVKKGKGR